MAVSDFVDGYLARHFGMASPLGALPRPDRRQALPRFDLHRLRAEVDPDEHPHPALARPPDGGARRPDRRRRPRHGPRPRHQVVPAHLPRQGQHIRRDLDGRGDPDEQHRPDAGLGRGRLFSRDGAPHHRLRRPLRLPGLRGDRPGPQRSSGHGGRRGRDRSAWLLTSVGRLPGTALVFGALSSVGSTSR